MDSMSKKHNYSNESKELEEEIYVKDYTEAEVEQYLRVVNSKDANSKFNTTFEGLNDNLQKLYVEDPTKDYQTCNFTYQPKSNYLSVISIKNRLLSIIETNSVVVIQGPTGCGKTTQIPQFILDASIKKKLNCNIIVTQPRRIAAINIAKRVSQESGWPLGSLVGYKVGMRKEFSLETRLTYCTTEILLNNLIHEKHMLRYTHIILDEIHERDQNLDFLLLVIKKLLQTNSGQVKIILMSATIDVTRFAEYFSTRVGNKLVPAPIVKIPEKRNFKICTYYLDEMENLGAIPEVSLEPKVTEDMIKFCSLIISALDQLDLNDNGEDSDSAQRHAVLIFLPGIYEIEELCNHLSAYSVNKLWDLVTLHSLISSDEQQRIFYKPPEGYRRIILSTNIAESSITVPDIKYVIDFCLIKMLEVDSNTHYQTLKLCWASKVNCIQRAGRAGRVMDGRVYRLVPKAFYDNIFNNEGTPEMLRAPLANLVLRAKILDLDEPRTLLSLSLNPPSLSNLAATILTLKEVGALVNENNSFQSFDGKLTDLGRIMAFLPLDIRITKLIMLGHVFGVLRDAIILGTSMTLRDIFNISQYRSDISSYVTRRKWAYDSNSDCIATLNIYKTWQNEKANRRLTSREAERQWAQRNEVHLKTLFELDALVNEITERLFKFGIRESVGINKVIWQDTDRDFVLQVALAGAFYPNYFIKRMQHLEIFKENITMNLGTFDPMKTVYLRGWPLNQPGYLYAKQFQEIFAKHQGIPEKQIAVFFDASKRVCVQFREKTLMNDNFYNISNFVYQAVKMRQCDVPININLLNIKEAQKMAKYYNVCTPEQTHFFHKDLRKTESNSHYFIYKTRPKLPGLDITEIPLFIQTIISPGYFWAILDATRNKLQNIEDILNKHPLKEFSSPPQISTIIAAPTERNDSLIYHRAIIEDFTSKIGDLVDIFFIDNGRSSRVRCSDLREINDTTILKIPPLAFRCNLAFLRPSNQANFHGQWSKISKNYFIVQIKKKSKIFGKIYSVVDNTVNLELITINEKGEKFNINNDMIEKGYARKKEESYLSTYNHELRMNINTMSMEEKQFYEEEQYDKDYLLKYPNPPKEFYNSSIKLQGPFSPLETELIQLTSVGKSKRTTIDLNSVNCVFLDEDHEQSLGCLLIAQIVSQGLNGGLSLKNTTFLPNIPGFAALLALSFAPYMELRCNSRRTCYTGALCGLGPMNDSTKQAMFPDHDMEIKFDVEITIDDVKEINKLRYWMNAGMQLDQSSNCDHIINCQNRIQRILLELRDKQRKSRNPLNEELDNYSDKWNYYDKLLFLPSIRETRQCDIYPLHKALELREIDEKKEDMLEHLLELQRFAYEDALKMKNVAVFCKLCGMETIGLLELRIHLCSEQHIKNEKTLRIIN